MSAPTDRVDGGRPGRDGPRRFRRRAGGGPRTARRLRSCARGARPRDRRAPRRRGVAGRRSRHQLHPAGSRRRPAGDRADRTRGSPTTTRRCTSGHGCTTARRRSSRAGSRAATTTATPTSWISISTRCTTIRPAPASRSARPACSATRSSSTIRGTTRAGTASGSRQCRSTRKAGRPSCAFLCRSSASPSGERQTWGVNAMRFIRRKNERDWLELVPKNESGRASRMAHLTGLDGLRPKRARRAAALHGRTRRIRAARAGREPVQRRLARVRGGRRRPEVGRDQQLDARRHRQPGFRTGGGRPGRRQPVAVRDLLSREAPVLPGRRADLRQLRAGRRQQLLGLQYIRPGHLLFTADRPDATGVASPESSPTCRPRRRFSAPPSSPARHATGGASAS